MIKQRRDLHMLGRNCILCVSLAAICLLASVAGAATYSISDIGPSLRPMGINASGQVAGFSINSPLRAFLWQNGSTEYLPTLGGVDGMARGINDSGQIVGCARAADGAYHAVVWHDGEVQDLGEQGVAVDINKYGDILGQKQESASWSSDVITDFGTLGGTWVSPLGINDSGKAVGYAELGEHYVGSDGRLWPYIHAFGWENGNITDLGGLDGDLSFAFDINTSGQMVGCSYSITTYEGRGFILQNGSSTGLTTGSRVNLGTLGGRYCAPRGVNDKGQVVGSAQTSDGQMHAFVWDNGALTDLNTLIPADSRWVLSQAMAINNDGLIVGLGLLDGKAHGFLLTPN